MQYSNTTLIDIFANKTDYYIVLVNRTHGYYTWWDTHYHYDSILINPIKLNHLTYILFKWTNIFLYLYNKN